MGSWPGSGERLVLVGMMGTGKTTVGKLLAARAGCELVDSDEQVQARTGRTVREIFETDGEEAFRQVEATVLAEALTAPGPVVIAAAGGVVLDQGNRERLVADGLVVWLTAAPEVLAARVVAGDHRPLLGDDPLAALRSLGAARGPLYREVADHVVEVDTRSADEAADHIWELVG